jgi:hypothetical protein
MDQRSQGGGVATEPVPSSIKNHICSAYAEYFGYLEKVANP